MERYQFISKLGEGNCGSVYLAIVKCTHECVAIKELKLTCDSTSEDWALLTLRHPNIVRLLDRVQLHRTVYFVFEYMQGSLDQLINTRRSWQMTFSEAEIQFLSFQVLQGLAFMHDGHGYMHRDMKPGNLLVHRDGVIKISDLGSAKKIKSRPPFALHKTTLWYKAPEMLLPHGIYDEKVDMWAMGAIIAELFLMLPLFKESVNSTSQFSDFNQYQLCLIRRVIGAPTTWNWDGMFCANKFNHRFPPLDGVGLRAMMPYASDEAIDLIGSLCSWDPLKRPSAAQALQHPFFKKSHYVSPPAPWIFNL